MPPRRLTAVRIYDHDRSPGDGGAADRPAARRGIRMSADRLGTRVESAAYRRMFALAGQCSGQASRITSTDRKSDSCRAGVAQRSEQPLYKGLNRVGLPAPVPPDNLQGCEHATIVSICRAPPGMGLSNRSAALTATAVRGIRAILDPPLSTRLRCYRREDLPNAVKQLL